MGKEITVESLVPQTVVRQLHDDAHRSLKSIADEAGVDRKLVHDLYHGASGHVAISVADALYEVQAKVELSNRRLARRWSL